VRGLQRGDAHPAVAPADVELSALPCLVAQAFQGGAGPRRQVEPGEPRADGVATLGVAPHQAVNFQGGGQAVGGGPGQAGGLHQPGQRQRSGLERVDDRKRLVQHTDPG
jgi:hypothetical protein